MSSFFTVEKNKYEYVVNKSRFIGICARVDGDADAVREIEAIRKEYRDCTHVCYAYLTGDSSRSSDDGEPSGTAGVPIMECIAGAKLGRTLVAVVRYFGGVKLGTGGLLRAYSHTAAQTLAQAEKIEVAECFLYKASFDFAVYKKIEKRSLQSLYKIVGLEYNRAVDVTYAVQNKDAFIKELTSLTQGKFDVEFLGREYVERRMS